MDITACTATETGMALTVDITLTDGQTTTHDTYTERSTRWLGRPELIAWANRTLEERWGVSTDWFKPEPEFDRIVLEAAIGIPDEECTGPDELFFPDGEVPEGWTSIGND